MEDIPYTAAKLSSVGLSDTAVYYAKLYLEHVLFSVIDKHERLDKNQFKLAVEHYSQIPLYFSRSDSEILNDLNRVEERLARDRVVNWLLAVRATYNDGNLYADARITDGGVALRFI